MDDHHDGNGDGEGDTVTAPTQPYPSTPYSAFRTSNTVTTAETAPALVFVARGSCVMRRKFEPR